jgi:apolipoprotein N-acyltransferase
MRGEDQILTPSWEQLRKAGHTSAVVVGGFGIELDPEAVDPEPKRRRYNSAFAYSPGQAEPSRYDKSHLVLFGEYVPFRGGRLHGLYKWLNRLTPWGRGGRDYSLSAGRQFTPFLMPSNSSGAPARGYRYATPICFEDTIPYVCRNFVRGEGSDPKRVDLLINISNDGWFGHSVELTQHLAVSVFRTVEHRVALARAVNTGSSGFVDPTGAIREVMPIGTAGTLTATVLIDSRVTLYTRWGDWFAKGCAGLALVVLLDLLVGVGRSRRAARRRKPNS